MIERSRTNDRMSQIVRHGGLIHLSGQVPSDTSDDIGAQTVSVLSKIEGLLIVARSSTSNVVSANIYLADMSDFAGMNAVWDTWFPPCAAPARTCVEAKLACSEVRVEITVIAAEQITKD